MASLSSRPWPLPPMWVTRLPSRRSSGSAVRKACSGPPTMTVRVPLVAAGTLPETGASIIVAPSVWACSASFRLVCGLTVLMST